MSASAATRLRQLATQYHGGELDLQSYRRMRAEILDRLSNLGGENDESSTTIPLRPRATAETAAPVAPPPPAPASAAPASPAPVAPTSAVQAQAPKASKAPPVATPKPAPLPQEAVAPPRKGAAPLIVVAVIALIGIGAAWFFLMRAAPEAEGLSEQTAATSESYHAINDFLAADDWSDEQIANFNTRWATLPDEMRNAALDQPWYQDFVERVRSQVKERRALTATAESAGTVEGPLSALASSVGIDISSPDTVLPVRINTSSSASGGGAAQGSEAGSPQKTSTQTPQHASPADAPAPAKTAAAPATVAQAGKPAGSSTNPAAASGAKKPVQIVPDTSPDRCRIEMANARKPRCRDALNIGGFGPYLAVYRAGEFEMGSKESSQEQPVHRVRIAKPFAIAEFEASQAEYQLFCTETRRACEPQPWTGEDLPVVRVNWQDARDYVEWLSAVSGKTYRLATEAEWEFAARNGGTALFPSGEALAQTDAVFSGVEKHSAPWPRSEKINANVPKATNTPQLYHAIGNVREWVEDAWSTSYAAAPDDGSARRTADSALRVVRGGAYNDAAPKLRFTTREGLDPSTRDSTTGFRVVREL